MLLRRFQQTVEIVYCVDATFRHASCLSSVQVGGVDVLPFQLARRRLCCNVLDRKGPSSGCFLNQVFVRRLCVSGHWLTVVKCPLRSRRLLNNNLTVYSPLWGTQSIETWASTMSPIWNTIGEVGTQLLIAERVGA